jgi:hypothetical protein
MGAPSITKKNRHKLKSRASVTEKGCAFNPPKHRAHEQQGHGGRSWVEGIARCHSQGPGRFDPA